MECWTKRSTPLWQMHSVHCIRTVDLYFVEVARCTSRKQSAFEETFFCSTVKRRAKLQFSVVIAVSLILEFGVGVRIWRLFFLEFFLDFFRFFFRRKFFFLQSFFVHKHKQIFVVVLLLHLSDTQKEPTCLCKGYNENRTRITNRLTYTYLDYIIRE